MLNILWIIMAYVLGSIPFGLIIAKNLCNVDPQKSGSKNIGATNVARLCGFRYGLATLFLDGFKGFLAVVIAYGISDSRFYAGLVALAALLGHMYSLFLRGKGGKGVATTVGVYMALAFWPLFWAVALTIGVIWLSGYVSLGSLTLVTIMPVFLLFSGKLSLIPVSFVILGFVFWKHKDNIERLLRGTEKSWKKDEEDIVTSDVSQPEKKPEQQQEREKKPAPKKKAAPKKTNTAKKSTAKKTTTKKK